MSDDNHNPSRPIPELWLERVALGEATDAERRELEDMLDERGESLEEHLERLRESNEQVLDAYPADMMAARIEARLDERRKAHERDAGRSSSRGGWFAGLGVLAAAAVAAFLVLNVPGEETRRPTDDPVETVRLKGAEPSLIVWRQTEADPERLEPGAAAQAGDILQLEYNGAGAKYGVIVSVDGRGAVTLHHPTAVDGDTKLEKGVVRLDFSYQLDDAPAFERFFFITSDEPIDAAQITAPLEALASADKARSGEPDFPNHTSHTDFTVEKN